MNTRIFRQKIACAWLLVIGLAFELSIVPQADATASQVNIYMAGPYLVRDLNPETSNPGPMTEMSGRLYFSADDGANGTNYGPAMGR